MGINGPMIECPPKGGNSSQLVETALALPPRIAVDASGFGLTGIAGGRRGLVDALPFGLLCSREGNRWSRGQR
jgi:hypothetical protein